MKKEIGLGLIGLILVIAVIVSGCTQSQEPADTVTDEGLSADVNEANTLAEDLDDADITQAETQLDELISDLGQFI